MLEKGGTMPHPVYLPVFGLLRRRPSAIFCLAMLVLPFSLRVTAGQSDSNADPIRSVIIEVYVTEGDSKSNEAIEAAREIAKSRKGIRLAIRKVGVTKGAKERLEKIADFFNFEPDQTPVIYCCNQVIMQAKDAESFKQQVETALQLEVFVRKGCPHCDAAKRFLPKVQEQYPGFKIVLRDILESAETRNDLNDLVRKHRASAVSTPVFHFCNSLIVGFDRESTTGARIHEKLDRWTMAAPPKPKSSSQDSGDSKTSTFYSPTAPEVASFFPF